MKWKRGIIPKQKDTLVAIDLEMFGNVKSRLHRPEGELALAAFADETCVYVVDNVPDLIKSYRNVENCTLAFHNAMYDIPHLRQYGLCLKPRPGHKVLDTLLIERILWNGYFDEFSLADCVRRECGFAMDKTERKEFKGARIPITDDLREYNATDAYYTRLLALSQIEHFKERPTLFKVWQEIDCPALFALMDMQGFMIDEKRWLAVAEQNRAKAEEIRNRLGFNPGSWQQVKQVAKEHGLDLKNTREEELEKFADNPIVREILQYRFFAKRASAYGQAFIDRLMEPDHRIYAPYNVTGAETGRMSSGMQQVPSRDGPEYRECFIADRGKTLIIADYHAQEPKLLAQMSLDPYLLDIFKTGQDVHLIVCRVVLKDDTIQKGDKREVHGRVVNARNEVGKVINLASSYGMTAIGLAMRLGCSVPEAQALLNEYFRRFMGVKLYINEQRALADRNHKVVTLGGRECWINPYSRQGENNAINSPIQGSAADVTKLAAALLHKRCLIMQVPYPVVAFVHDEMVLEVPTKEAKKWAKILKECMTEAITLLAPDVNHAHAVDISIGKSWAAKH